jgi:hypothetical protein
MAQPAPQLPGLNLDDVRVRGAALDDDQDRRFCTSAGWWGCICRGFGSAGSQHGERVMSCTLLSAALASAFAGRFVGLIALL